MIDLELLKISSIKAGISLLLLVIHVVIVFKLGSFFDINPLITTWICILSIYLTATIWNYCRLRRLKF